LAPANRIEGRDLVTAESRSAKLFVSYASDDRRLIEPLVDFLRRQGWEVWWDRQLEAGEAYDRRLERELAAADCVVVVWSRTSVASNWVLSEAMAGFESNRLVPVALDARLSIPLPFNRIHAASLVDWTGIPDHPGLQELAEGIRATISTLGMRGVQARESSSQRKSVVAVLPFDDLDATGAARPVCSVVPNKLISALSRFPGLDALSRRASFDAGLQSLEIRAIARALRADFIVTGSVSGTGGGMVLGVELIEGDTGRQTWSMTVTPDESGGLDPDAAAADIARALSGEFLRLGRASAQDAAARGDSWSVVEAGRHTLLQSSSGAIVAAKAEAQRALALAPDNGHAHALLASVIAEEIVNGYASDVAFARSEALKAVEKALVLCSDDPVVLKYAGHVFAICGEHEQGERVLRRALELNLYDDGAYGYLGWVLAPSTSPTHLAEITAVLDKLLAGARKHPGRPFWFLHRSVALSCAGDFEGALAAARDAANFSPGLTLAWLHAVNALAQLGRTDEARALVERCPLGIARPGISWANVIRLISRDEAAAERRTAGLRLVRLA
jgi:TolB-like protein/tetratricopeptide (TPR) repeat protein